jgi:tRNA pseudouridine55 synthase
MRASEEQRKKRYQPAAPRELGPFDGLLIVDKPAGPTSHDIVHNVRKNFSIKKVGHGGTLDPQATGVLILLLGKATKQSRYFISCDKSYEGTMHLGVSTDTQDMEGNVLKERDPAGITAELVEEEMKKFSGDLLQKPPMVSAVKVNGVPLYKKARKGEVVERKAKLVHIYDFRMLQFDMPRMNFRLRCSKGTYVRTLCSDLGENLGCGAYLERLRRTQCGEYGISDAVAFSRVMEMNSDELAQVVMPLSRILPFQGPARP